MSNNAVHLVVIISGPSGVGKSTLIRCVMEEDPSLAFSISHTTLPPRPGEIDGRDYYFVSRESFERLIKENAFLEWANVYGEYYGTSRGEIDRLRDLGKDVILDIDVQGAKQVMERMDRGRWVSVFIRPPDLETLRQRLIARGKDPISRIETRLAAAEKEIAQAPRYDYQIVNENLAEAASHLSEIIRQEREKRQISR